MVYHAQHMLISLDCYFLLSQKFLKNRLLTDDIKSLSLALLCSWENECPSLQVREKNAQADNFFIKEFIVVPQLHTLQLHKKFLKTYTIVFMQQCCREGSEAISIIIDYESRYLPCKLVI